MAMIWIAIAALLVGILVLLGGRAMRRRRGLTEGRTLDLDSRVLHSARYGLSGRPDRLVRDVEFVIPEEWKSSRKTHDSHRAQLDGATPFL